MIPPMYIKRTEMLRYTSRYHYTHTRTHIHIHTHTHAHAHTHTHTHAGGWREDESHLVVLDGLLTEPERSELLDWLTAPGR